MSKLKKGLVSIVVPTHGYRDLEHLRNSVENSLYKDIELIIVNRNQERSIQRNYGIDMATGEFLLWLDSDQSISPFLIGECVKKMRDNPQCSSFYIPEIIVVNSFFGRIRKFEREFYTGTPIDCVRFLRMELAPRFNLDLHGPEDSDFDRRVPPVKMITKSSLYHHDDIQPKEYFSKKAYYTQSMKKFEELWPNDKCTNLKYRCFDVFVENGKWKKILRHPILFLGVFIIIAIRGVIYVRKR